jgi:hypothetical protein
MLSRMKVDAGLGLATLLIAVGSILAGGAAAAGAVVAVINSYGPADHKAVQNGPKDLVPPDQILSYGG